MNNYHYLNIEYSCFVSRNNKLVRHRRLLLWQNLLEHPPIHTARWQISYFRKRFYHQWQHLGNWIALTESRASLYANRSCRLIAQYHLGIAGPAVARGGPRAGRRRGTAGSGYRGDLKKKTGLNTARRHQRLTLDTVATCHLWVEYIR